MASEFVWEPGEGERAGRFLCELGEREGWWVRVGTEEVGKELVGLCKN